MRILRINRVFSRARILLSSYSKVDEGKVWSGGRDSKGGAHESKILSLGPGLID